MLKARRVMAQATSKKVKNGEAEQALRKWVRPVRFDFNRHGLRSASVPVEGPSTEKSVREASMRIAAAIRQAWAKNGAEDDEEPEDPEDPEE
jgi:hypothetical protein